MKKHEKKAPCAPLNCRRFGVAACVVAAVAAVLWCVLLLTVRDTDTNSDYFLSGAVAPWSFAALLAVAALGLLLAGMRLHQSGVTLAELPEGSAAVFFSAMACGLLLLASSAVLLIRAFAVEDGLSTASSVVAALLAVPGGLFFPFLVLPEGILPERQRRTLTVVLGLCGVLFFLVYAMSVYFEPHMNMNSPFKLLDQAVAVLTAFLLLAETRFRLGRGRVAVLLPLCAGVLILGLAAALGGVVSFFARGEALRNTVLHDFLLLVLALYAGARLRSVAQKLTPRRSALLQDIAARAVEQDEELARQQLMRSELYRRHHADAREEPNNEKPGQQTIDFSTILPPREDDR